MLHQAIALQPDLAAAHHSLGLLLQRTGSLIEAEQSYRVALAREAANPAFCSSLASVLELQGRLTEALKHYREALKLNPDNKEVAGSIGSVLLALGEAEEGLLKEQQGFGVVIFDSDQGVRFG